MELAKDIPVIEEIKTKNTSSSRCPKHEFEKRTKIGLCSWFFFRNFFQIVPRVFMLIVLAWVCFGGGMTMIIKGMTSTMSEMAKSNGLNNNKGKKDGIKKQQSKSKSKSVSIAGQGGKVQEIPLKTESIYSYVSNQKNTAEVSVQINQIKIAEAEKKQLEKEILRLKEMYKKAYLPVFITEREAVLVNGLTVRVGYVFKDEGEFKDVKVKRINCKDRAIELDNGVILRMCL